jgi:hypothetical protein
MTMAKSTEAALRRLEREEGTIKEKWADYRLIEEFGTDHQKWELEHLVVRHPLPLPGGKIRKIISFLGLIPREPIDEISSGLIWKNSVFNFHNYPGASFIVLDSSIKFDKAGLPILQEVKVVQRPTQMRMNNSTRSNISVAAHH